MNIADVLLRSCETFSTKTAIIFEGKSWTFKQLHEEVERRMALLSQSGIGKGDRVAIQLPKSMDFIFFHLATMATRAISLPLNPDYTGEEIEYYLRDSCSSLYVTNPDILSRVERFLEPLENLSIILVDDASHDRTELVHTVIPGKMGKGYKEYPSANEDVAVICYTSGTTGKPKGAMITHRNLIANMQALKTIWEWTERDVLLHVLPLFHIHGLFVALHGAINAGSTVVMHKRFDARRTWESIEKEKCTMLMAVPTMYHRMLNEWEKGRYDLKTMRVFISGSAPLSEKLFRRFEQETGFRILERYGMTEAGMIASNPILPVRRKAQSVGYPLPGVEVRIVSEKGEDAGSLEVGEVWVRGDNVFKGYWGKPQLRLECFDGDWFKTGDLGYRDWTDEGRLYLVGRARDLIISGGYNVYPKEVEDVLLRHEGVQEAAVIGVPDEDLGERVTAFIVSAEGDMRIDPNEIIAFCRRHLVGYKCPKQIFFVEKLPRNAMGKVQKDVLASLSPRSIHTPASKQ